MTARLLRAGGPAPLDALRAAFGDAFARHAARRRAHAVRLQVEGELSMMTDRQLADMGLLRCDIPRFARKAAGL